MKLLFNTNEIEVAEEAKSLLEKKGIPVFISNRHQDSIRKYYPKLLGVWVYLNEQEADARRVLSDRSYEIDRPIDVGLFYSKLQEESFEDQSRSNLLKWMVITLFVIVLVTVLLGLILTA
ncbi:MAG: DUF2007 domain-containing protein [Candidatus Thiodiazotropha endolucinida]|nr:DUF2007 domain-containing protein [Candidatus Thiodiazotropha taylori]MCW4319974.1 DUF2007 domain-containing protein [Candidatus Thiodiazotropha taylori]